MDFLQKIEHCTQKGELSPRFATILYKFYISYSKAVAENGYDISTLLPLLDKFLDLVLQQLADPYTFEPFHQRITEPFNYYQLGLDIIRPLIVFSKSRILGLEHVKVMETLLSRGDNVILLANHQTEPDPQAISLLLEKTYPRFAEEMIFVAGHRVISDPLAVPLSKGRNLLCIFSKKYIENPPEFKQSKLLHNQRTMKRMSQLLAEGSKCIYVAPSGGRDRPNAEGKIEVARFDPHSIEMFSLMAKQSGRPTHFYPLALATFDLLPPPNSVENELGEKRSAHCTSIHLAFGPEIAIQNVIENDLEDKKQKRQRRADYIWEVVCQQYALLVT
jgi:glycerol-3-phosphate O-acyltransferase